MNKQNTAIRIVSSCVLSPRVAKASHRGYNHGNLI